MQVAELAFSNRALIFGLVFGLAFSLYAVDHENAGATLANWLGATTGASPDTLVRILFGVGALLIALAALLRTWASSFLRASVVYGRTVSSAELVANGPYRRVRNPLYLANIWMALGMGLFMSRSGLIVALVLMLAFCYWLIVQEEAQLAASQGSSYERYRQTVPRLWFSLRPRVPDSGAEPQWGDGFRAELWYWGFAAAATVFAITLNVKLFFLAVGTSIALLWLTTFLTRRKPDTPGLTR